MANPNTKPAPLYPTVPRAACPICGHTSYSTTGIHPQCAMLAADKILVTRINARKHVQPQTPASPALRRDEKRCPKCRGVTHVRRHKCDCGYVFVVPKVHKDS